MPSQTKIKTTRIPGTELKPSRIALGTWAIGGWMWGGSDDALSIRTSSMRYGWRVDAATMAEIDRILAATVKDPVGPEFMAPPGQVAA